MSSRTEAFLLSGNQHKLLKKTSARVVVIFTSSPGTQNKIAYEKEMLSTPKDVHRQGRAGLKS